MAKRGHRRICTALAVSPDGSRVASAQAYDGIIKVWDRDTGRERFSRDAQYALGQCLEPAGGGVILRAGQLQLPVPNLDPAAFTA